MTEEKGFNIFKSMATVERRWVYLVIFLVVLYPVFRPIGMPISVSPSTQTYYNWLTKVTSNDVVFFAFETGFESYMELKGGTLATVRMIIEKEAKMFVAFATADGLAVFQMIMGDPDRNIPGVLTPEMQAHSYKYWEDYIILGYVLVNEPSTLSMAQNFHGFIYNDFAGKPIKGSFLDRIQTPKDIALIIDFSPGMQTTAIIRHWVMSYGTPMIEGAIGVNIPSLAIYLETGLLKAILQSTRGGAELEFLTGHPGPGLTAMDSFTLVHYLLIAIIIMGNIGFFAWERKAHQRATPTPTRSDK